MNMLIVILLFAGVVFWDYIPVVKAGNKKRTWIYGAFLAVSFCVLLLYSLDVPLPSFDRMLSDALES